MRQILPVFSFCVYYIDLPQFASWVYVLRTYVTVVLTVFPTLVVRMPVHSGPGTLCGNCSPPRGPLLTVCMRRVSASRERTQALAARGSRVWS